MSSLFSHYLNFPFHFCLTHLKVSRACSSFCLSCSHSWMTYPKLLLHTFLLTLFLPPSQSQTSVLPATCQLSGTVCYIWWCWNVPGDLTFILTVKDTQVDISAANKSSGFAVKLIVWKGLSFKPLSLTTFTAYHIVTQCDLGAPGSPWLVPHCLWCGWMFNSHLLYIRCCWKERSIMVLVHHIHYSQSTWWVPCALSFQL